MVRIRLDESRLRSVIRSVLNEMRAYHGSGARFGRFDGSYAGSGEGSSSFGPGHYFTSSKQIGLDYANEHGTSMDEISKFSYDGNTSYHGVLRNIINQLCKLNSNYREEYDDIVGEANRMYDNSRNASDLIRRIMSYAVKRWKMQDPDYDRDYEEYYRSSVVRFARGLREKIKDIDSRTLYQVDIPDEDRYADWSMEVPESWIDKVYYFLEGNKNEEACVNGFRENIESYMRSRGRITVETFYYSLDNMYYDNRLGINIFKAILKRNGYVGVKYPSGQNFSTSSTKEGDMNYTVFDDDNVSISKRWDL